MNKNNISICFVLLFSLITPFTGNTKESSGFLTIIHSAVFDTYHTGFSSRNSKIEKALRTKQAELFQKVRATEADVVFVNAGSISFSDDSIGKKSQTIIKAYAELNYDVINLSYRGFREGKKTTQQIIKSRELSFISANLKDKSTGELLAKPFIIKNSPTGMLAILGITQLPAGLVVLPHLQKQLAGVQIESPVKAIKKWLPKAKAQADHIILLYYGSWAGLKPIKEKFGSELTAILVGGIRAEYLPQDTVPPIIGTSGNGQHVALIKLNLAGKAVKADVTQIPLDSNISSDPEIQKLIGGDFSSEKTSDISAKVIGVLLEQTDSMKTKAPESEVTETDQQKTPDRLRFISPPFKTAQDKLAEKSSAQPKEPIASGENKAVRISVLRFEERESIDGKSAPKGMKFLVLNTHWQNIHPKQSVDKDRLEGKRDPTMGVGGLGWGGSSKPKEFVEMDVAYQIPRLLDHAYVLADGVAYHLHATTDVIQGGIARGKTFSLAKHGAAREGRLVFSIPSNAKALGFQFFDFSYGEIVLPIQGKLVEAHKMSAPVLATAHTKRLDLFVKTVDFRSAYQGREAPTGWHYAVLGLGGKILLGTPEAGQILQISPQQYFWTRTEDGYFYYAADSATAEQGMLRFTPQVPAYQEIAFLLPEDAKKFDLGVRLQNEVVWLTLSDKGLSKIPEAVVTHRDKNVMQVSVYGVRSEAGRQIVDIGIQSLQKQQGIEIQTRSQFALMTDKGKVRLDTAATWALLHHPPEPFIIPADTYLRFELAYETLEQPEALYFRGFESEAKLALTTALTDKARMVKTEKEEKSQVRPQPQPSSLTAHNEAVELTVVNYEFVESIHGQKAGKDHAFVVLSTHWKNILKKPKKDVPWAHRSLGNFSQTKPDIEIAFLSDKKGHLFLKTEGINKITLSPLTQYLPMPMTGNQFIISKLGDEAEGKVAFQVNKSTLRSPVLTLLDPNYGDIRINLPDLEQAGLIAKEDQQQDDKELVSHTAFVKTIDQKEEIAVGSLKHQNLSSLATLNVSSSNSGVRVYSPKRAIDGNLDTSWFTADGDAANQGKTPFFELVFDKDVIVHELKMFGNREYANGYDFISGVFQLFDQSGNELYNSKVVELPAPHRDISLSIPDIPAVRRVRFSSMSDESIEPGFAELEVFGVFQPQAYTKIDDKTEKHSEYDSSPGIFAGHWYQAIALPEGVRWLDAKLWAEAMGGYLASINSAEENEFVYQLVKGQGKYWETSKYSNGVGPWIGGFQVLGAPETKEGWSWVHGDPWEYANWQSPQPDNLKNIENVLHFWAYKQKSASTWNDTASTAKFKAFVVEYDSKPLHNIESELEKAHDQAWFEKTIRKQANSFRSHQYRVISAPQGVDWAEASALARKLGGYLAVITSQAENDYVYSLTAGNEEYWCTDDWSNGMGPWIGGMRLQSCSAPSCGWTWPTGEAWDYSNWYSDSPNNSGGHQDRLHFIGYRKPEGGSHWNDIQADYKLKGFVVEWGETKRSAKTVVDEDSDIVDDDRQKTVSEACNQLKEVPNSSERTEPQTTLKGKSTLGYTEDTKVKQRPQQTADANEFISLSVDTVEIASELAGVKAGEANEFVVVSLRFSHLGKGVGSYDIPQVSDNLFLIAGEGYTAEIADESARLGAATLPGKFELSSDSAEVTGKVAFRVRKRDLDNLSIAFLEARFKDITVPLQGGVKKTPEHANYGAYHKGKLQAAVYGVECLKEKCYLDIGFKSGIKNTTLQYDLSSSIYLVRDGYDYVPLAEAEAPYNAHKVTLFNPDRERRGFLALPRMDENTHYGLYLGLPDGHHFTAALTPERNLPTLPAPQKTFSDGSMADVSVLEFKQVENIADIKPSQGSQLLVLDLLVSSPSDTNTYLNIEPLKQFVLQNKMGKRWKAKSLVYLNSDPDKQVFKSLGGMTRRFTLVYDVPESQQKLRLEYSGFQEQKILPLTLKTLSGEEEFAGDIKPDFNAVLSENIPDNNDYFPANVFSDEIKKLYLVMTSTLEKYVKVKIDWYATEVEGREKDEKLTKTATMSFKPGQSGILTLKRPKGLFIPGKYRIELLIDGLQKIRLPFEIRLKYPSAELITDDSQVPVGFNIALSMLGGKVERWTSEKDNTKWAAKNLIDGKAIYFQMNDLVPCHSCGWSSKDAETPQKIVFSFHKRRTAQIQGVIINSTTYNSQYYPDEVVKYAEVWVSQENPDRGFKKISGARLGSEAGRYLIRLPETAARYVKIIFLSNYAGNTFQSGEVEIVEKAEQEASILRDYPINLALPSLGGALVRWTSQRSSYHGANDLIDNTVETEGWFSKYKYDLPQDFVFAFDDDQEVFLSSIIINPKTIDYPESWPKWIQVSVSKTSPFDEFKDVGSFLVAKEPVFQTFNLGHYARFVRLRILETYGNKSYASLGEVQLIEGWEKGYQSILLRRDDPTTIKQISLKTVLRDEGGFIMEKEPNDNQMQANKLELNRFAKGHVDPLGEKDFWKLHIPGTKPVITKFEVMGTPNIRTSLSLSDTDNRMLHRFHPGTVSSERTSFSWRLNAGDQLIEVTEPPASVVVIWDTSGSMDGNTKALQEAVKMYLDQLRPEDQAALIHFSETVNVLTKLTNDKEKMSTAIKGKFFAVGGTAVYDALIKGLSLLNGVQGNRAVILMTDGQDTDSKFSYSDLWRKLDEERVRIYSIGLGRHWDVYLPQVAATGKRYLNNISSATNGKAFFAPSKTELKSIYQGISDELQQISTYYLKPQIVKVAPPEGNGYLSVSATRDVLLGAHRTQIELILDASGSMRERKRKIDGRLKIDVAKDVMHELIDGLPEGMEVGLRVYGHRIREGRTGDCQDSELLVPFGTLDKDRLHQQVAAMTALGTTPLSYSLLKAAEDFSQSPGEKILILVTDGKEECGMDPSFAARTLISKGLKVRVDVVGFALAEEKTKADMREVAAITGGRFYDAQDRSELLNALRSAISLPYKVFNSDGKLVASGNTGGDAKKLRDDIYTVKVQPPGQEILEFKDIRIAENQYTLMELHLDQKQVKPQILGPYTRQAAEQIQVKGEPLQSSVTIDKQSKLQVLLVETNYGLKVKRVKSQGLAQQAGIKSGDLLTHIDGKPLRHEIDLRRTLKLVAQGKQPSGVITVRRAANELAIQLQGKQKKQWQTEVTTTPTVSQSERVHNAQRWLSQLGFRPGPADGLWGSKTARAVKDFQRWYPDSKLSVSGQLDNKTYQAMESAAKRGLKKRLK